MASCNNDGSNNHDNDVIDCSTDLERWLQIIGTTFLLAMISSLLSTHIKRGECAKAKGRPMSCLSYFGISASLMAMVAYDIFPKATKLMLLEREEMDTKPSSSKVVPFVVGLMALYGFLMPIFGHLFPIIINMIPNDEERHNKSVVDEQFTVNDEEDCLSCDTCNKEEDITESNQNNQDGVMDDHPTSEHTTLLPRRRYMPPRYIRIKNGGQYSEHNDQSSMSDISQHRSCDYRGIGSLVYLFMHGIFIGTTIISLSKLDGTFVLACTVALVHGIYLEQRINVDVADNRTFIWLRGMLLVSGGTVAKLIGDSNVALGIVLAVAGGLYVNLALTMVMYQVKQLICSRSQSTQDISCYYCSKLDASRHHYQNQSMGLDTPLCIPIAGGKSRQQGLETPKHIAIPSPMQADEVIEHIPYHLIRKYDSATWRMYNRIQSAREARAKCQICFGSIQDNESATAVGKSREEQRLVQTCPSPLYQEEDAKTSMNVHQECYYGSTIEQHTGCPRKLLWSEDNHIFHMDL